MMIDINSDADLTETAHGSYLGLGVHICSIRHQEFHHVCLSCPGSHVQRRLASLKHTQKKLLGKGSTEFRQYVFVCACVVPSLLWLLCWIACFYGNSSSPSVW